MFELSFGEIALILVIALLVVGPEKLPGIARTLGLWLGKARRFAASVKADIDRELQTEEIKRLVDKQAQDMARLRTMLDETRVAIDSEQHRMASEVLPAHPETSREADREIGQGGSGTAASEPPQSMTAPRPPQAGP
jgi:sec-independent protein translocase protein TatB